MSTRIRNRSLVPLGLSLCMVACLAACGPNKTARVTGNLSSNDVVQIKRAACAAIIKRLGSASNHPLKSIQVTTNNLHEIEGRLRSSAREPSTTEKTTSPPVAVWYVDANARWGEAGYILQKGTNDWKVTVELFQ